MLRRRAQTRCVLVTLNMYNGNYNYYCQAQFAIEYSAGGTVVPTSQVCVGIPHAISVHGRRIGLRSRLAHAERNLLTFVCTAQDHIARHLGAGVLAGLPTLEVDTRDDAVSSIQSNPRHAATRCRAHRRLRYLFGGRYIRQLPHMAGTASCSRTCCRCSTGSSARSASPDRSEGTSGIPGQIAEIAPRSRRHLAGSLGLAHHPHPTFQIISPDPHRNIFDLLLYGLMMVSVMLRLFYYLSDARTGAEIYRRDRHLVPGGCR